MSFILEALKKSEQQRQQQNTSQQQVRKRTLSLQSRRSGRRPYWLLAGLLALIMISGWLLYSKTAPTLEQSPAANRSMSAPSLNQPGSAEPAVTTSSVASTPQKPVVAAESAPVPRNIVSSPAPLAQTFPTVPTSKKSNEPVSELRTIDLMLLEPTSAQLPLYLDMSRELRDRIPRLTMSMHFYTTNPDRRLVRINNYLLHEDDWVNRDLQVVEITPTGATLDFLGKFFEMRSPSR